MAIYHSSTLVSECLPVRPNLRIKEKFARLTLLIIFKMLTKLKSKNEMQRETYMQLYPAT